MLTYKLAQMNFFFIVEDEKKYWRKWNKKWRKWYAVWLKYKMMHTCTWYVYSLRFLTVRGRNNIGAYWIYKLIEIRNDSWFCYKWGGNGPFFVPRSAKMNNNYTDETDNWGGEWSLMRPTTGVGSGL